MGNLHNIMSCFKNHTPLFLVATMLVLTFATPVNAYQNVLGTDLQPCSKNGMALTGFTRNSKCVDRNDDAGSHHVCIDMSSTSGGNFCTVTGQPNWCSESMLCNNGKGKCKIENWCVCEWAFSSYIQKAGGCDKISKIHCESTNMMALKHYEEQASRDNVVKLALECLKQKCNL